MWNNFKEIGAIRIYNSNWDHTFPEIKKKSDVLPYHRIYLIIDAHTRANVYVAAIHYEERRTRKTKGQNIRKDHAGHRPELWNNMTS